MRATFQSLSVRNYRLYISGHLISDMGTWMQKVSQVWLVLELTGSGTLLGVTAALQHLPILLIGPWGGLLADRLNKRRLLLVTHVLAGLLALVLGLLTAFGWIELWMVLLLAFGLGTINAMEKPARQTFVFEMVGPVQLANAITLNSIVANAGKIGGPAAAGILISAFGLASSFLVNAGSYLAVVLSLVLMRRDELTPAEPAHRQRGQLREGLRYVRKTPQLFGPLVLMMVAGTFAFVWTVTLPLLARDGFGGDAQVFGMMFSAMGAGAVLGGLVFASRLTASTRQLVRLALIFGLLVVVTASAPTLPVALVALFCLGGITLAFRAAAISLVQLQSAPPLRGRVMALLLVALVGTAPAGAPLVGWLAELYGARAAMALGGVATMVAGLVTLFYLERRGLGHRSEATAVSPSQAV